MSMKTYEALTEPAKSEGMCFLTEKSPIWAGMLADVLKQHGIPFTRESTLGAGMAIQTGSLLERIRFYVPASYLAAAKDLVDELFSGEGAEE